MKAYKDIVSFVLDNGIKQSNRTGIDTLSVPGMMFKHDMRTGFPAVTTKKLFFDQVKGELLGFLRGANTAKEFNDLGCKVWDLNARAKYWTESSEYTEEKSYLKIPDEAGFLGRIYGVQWRNWEYQLDQIQILLDTIEKDPTSRRMIVTSWNPSELRYMALPPCHFAFQVMTDQTNKLMHLTWYQRSCDVFLGLPFNIASYALLLELLAYRFGYTPCTLTGFLSDTHIYENHVKQCRELLTRDPLPLPEIKFNHKPDSTLDKELNPRDIELINYQHHPAIKAEMAV